jgi:hypothetical protein
MRQGPLWIVEPPLSTGERMSVNDPFQSSVTGSFAAFRSQTATADVCQPVGCFPELTAN